MARITVEDCLKHVDNRFDLVLLAAKRARMLANRNKIEMPSTTGVEKATKNTGNYKCPPYPLLDAGIDKPTVIALREIAAGLVTKACMEQEEKDIDIEHSASIALSQRIPIDNRYFED